MGNIRRTILLLCCSSLSAWGLIPLQNLLLEDLSPQERENLSDPLNYVRLDEEYKRQSYSQAQEKLALYRGHFIEGENLAQSCQILSPVVQYAQDWNQRQALRSIVSTLQLIGLDTTVKAIASYAHYFEFSANEYDSLVKRLTQNYCSQNLTTVGKLSLKKNLHYYFNEKKNFFPLPSVKDNPLFPAKLLSRYSQPEIELREKEFASTVELFRAFCSWNGLVDDFRLMVPLVRNPSLMAFVFRQMQQEKLRWDAKKDEIYLDHDPQGVQVACENLICRKVSPLRFNQLFPRGIGTKSSKEDMQRLYCSHLRDADYQTKNQVPQIKEWLSTFTPVKEALLKGQLTALLTGVPEFFLHVKDFPAAKKMARASFDHTWNEWAKLANRGHAQQIYYEEPLVIEPTKAFYQTTPDKPQLHLSFDVNLGEIDRAQKEVGKLAIEFELPFSESYLAWLKQEWEKRNAQEQKLLALQLKEQIAPQISLAQKKWAMPPWKEGLDQLVAYELLDYIHLLPANQWHRSGQRDIPLIISLRYGPFALSYLHQKLKNHNKSSSLDR